MSDLSYFSRLIRGGESLLYSFESGIGMSQAGSIGTMLNPVNLLAPQFDITDYANMYTWVIVCSTALSGFTMYVLLARMRPSEDASNLIFSTAYALMGFNVAYCFLYSFLLQSAILPLVALGVRKILWGERPWLYVASFCCSALASYYFAYMIGISAVILFVMWWAEERTDVPISPRRRVLLTFVLSTICAVLLATVVWLPSFLSIVGGRLEQNTIFDLTFNENMGTLDSFSKLFAGANSTAELESGLPNLFVGAFPVFLVFAFFADERNSKRQKLCRGLAMGFYLLTFYIKALSMAMQGFSDTNWFNYRYSFVLSLLVLLTATEQYPRFGSMSHRDLRRSLVVYACLSLLVFSKQYAFVSGGSLLLACAILSLVLAAFSWNYRDPKRAPKGQLALLVLIVCSVELYANYVLSVSNVSDWEAKADVYRDSLFYGSVYPESIQQSDRDFYRMVNENTTNSRCDNDPRLFGYDGTSYMGSQERNFVFRGLSSLGQPWYANRTWYTRGLPSAYDSLLGLRYVVSPRDLTAEKGYERVVGRDDAEYLYRNQNALPLCLLSNVDGSLEKLGKNPFDNLNSLWASLSGDSESVFTEERDLSFTYGVGIAGNESTQAEAQSTMSVLSAYDSSDGLESGGSPQIVGAVYDTSSTDDFMSPYWVDCTFTARQNGPVYAYSASMVDANSGYALEAMQYLGIHRKGDEVKARIYQFSDFTEEGFAQFCSEYYVAYENQDVLARCAHDLQEASGTIERVSDDHLTGHVDAKEEGRLFFTIPYDEGWTLTVDGAEVPMEMDAGLFMSAPAAAGEHDWEMRFVPVGLVPGAAMSAVGLALAAVLAVLDRRWRGKGDKGAGPALPEGEDAA